MPLGEGFLGQCAVDMRRILVDPIPADTVPIGSALLQVLPRALVFLPVVFEGQIKAVIGLASLISFTPSHLGFLEQLTTSIGIVFNSIEATMQTEALPTVTQLRRRAHHRHKECSRKMSSWRKRLRSLPSRTSRWSARTRRSNRRAAPWSKKRRNWR